MDIHLESLSHAVIAPFLNTLSKHIELPKLTNYYLLTAAAIGLKRNPSLFHSEQGSYGLFHITEKQHLKLWDDHLVKTPDLASKIRGLASQHQFLQTPHQELSINLNYATAIAAYAISLNEQAFKVGLPLHQEIALFNSVFPGFRGINRKEWLKAHTLLTTDKPTPVLLSSDADGTDVDDTEVAVCA